jgi:hypothetical protein
LLGKPVENHPFARLRRCEYCINIDLRERTYEDWNVSGNG